MERYEDPGRIYSYKYICENHSVIDRLLKYWWRIAIKFVPARMSANLLSIIGNTGSWLAVILLMLSGFVASPVRPWLFGLAGLGIMFYHTVDCLDGMQARRIGSAGPLGEFVDHWFDSMNVFFFPLGIIAAFPGIPNAMGIFLVMMSMFADWIILREVEKTNRLTFSYFSTEEAIVIYWLLLLSMSFMSYDFWALPHPSLGLPPIFLLTGFVAAAYVHSFVTTLVRLRFEGFRELLVHFLCVAPLAVWILAASKGTYPRFSLFLGLLTIGFVGSRHIGDLLRTRLIGLAYPAWYPDLVLCSISVLALAIAGLVRPDIPYWLFTLPVVAMLGLTFVRLALQFLYTIRRVRECLGFGLFHVPAPTLPAPSTGTGGAVGLIEKFAGN